MVFVPPDPTDAAMVRQFLGQHLRLLRAATPQDSRFDLEAAQMATGAFPAVQTAPILDAIAIVDRGFADLQKTRAARFATWLFPAVLDHVRREHGLWASLLQGRLDPVDLTKAAFMHGGEVAVVASRLLDPGAPAEVQDALRRAAGWFDEGVKTSADGALAQLTNVLRSPGFVTAPKAMPTWWLAHEDAENAALVAWLRRAGAGTG